MKNNSHNCAVCLEVTDRRCNRELDTQSLPFQNFLPKAVVTRFGGVLPRKMAEWTIAQMVATERNFAAQIQNQLNGTW